MNALEKIKGSVNEGVKAIEGKITQLEVAHAEEKALKEKQKADREKEKLKKIKAREAARNRKRRSLLVRRILSGVLCGVVIAAVGVWYIFDHLNALSFEMPVRPVWALGIIALGLALTLTGRGVPIKIGVSAFGLLLLIRENGWLWGALEGVSVWKLLAAAGVLIAVIYITWGIVNLKNGAKRRWRKTRKAIDKKKADIQLRIDRTKEKLKRK